MQVISHVHSVDATQIPLESKQIGINRKINK